MVGLGTFRDPSVAFRRDDGVGMGGSSGPKVVGWVEYYRYNGPMARVLVLAMHHFDTMGHPGSSHSGIEIFLHTWDGAFLAISRVGKVQLR